VSTELDCGMQILSQATYYLINCLFYPKGSLLYLSIHLCYCFDYCSCLLISSMLTCMSPYVASALIIRCFRNSSMLFSVSLDSNM
jgi:hypothetical protein